MRSLLKNPANYETERKENCEFEQKPLSFDDFNDAEEEEVKKRAEKRKARRRELAEHLKAQKQEIKEGKIKVKEDQMWQRLSELNGEFKKIKKAKNEAKKMSETTIN